MFKNKFKIKKHKEILRQMLLTPQKTQVTLQND